MKLRSVIVDDERLSRETLKNYLGKYCPDVDIVGMAESVETGLKVIKTSAPDIVFLDIEMPFGNAFDLIEKIDHIDFEIIFVTAYSHYAIKALNLSASYYILKPIDIEELIQAVEKIKQEKLTERLSWRAKILLENIQAEEKQNQKIILPLIDGFDVVRIKDIVRCQANDNFTDFYFVSQNKKSMISRTLKYYEKLLADYDFIRTHKAHLVNFHHITKYVKGKGGYVILSNGHEASVSELRKKELLARFQPQQ